MPTAKIRDVTLTYEILGDGGPFVALQPGGRRAGASLRPLAQKIAEAGNRVVIYDRRNTGASDIAIDGESENQEWADDLHALLREIDAQPAFVGGSSSGCRLALLLALQHPEAVRGLLLWRVTGGAHAGTEHDVSWYAPSLGLDESCARVLGKGGERLGHRRRGELERLGDGPHRAQPGQRHQELQPARLHSVILYIASSKVTWT